MKFSSVNKQYAILIMLLITCAQNYTRTSEVIELPLHDIILDSDLTPQEKIVRMDNLLRDTKVNIDQTDANGRTVLNLATFYKADPAIIQFLIDNKAQVNIPDRFNESPLHNAIEREEIAVADMLLQVGADPLFKNDQNETPADLARTESTKAIFDGLDIGSISENGDDDNLAIPNLGGQTIETSTAFDKFERANNSDDDLDVSQELQ